MDAGDVELRNETYAFFAERGRAPRADELGRPRAEVEEAWRRLHDVRALVLNPSTLELRMLNPFSCVPTAYRVAARGRTWYANCAWDAFGVCAALESDGRIEASCPDCGQPIAVDVRDGRMGGDAGLVFHCLVPARHWWDDIVFT